MLVHVFALAVGMCSYSSIWELPVCPHVYMCALLARPRLQDLSASCASGPVADPLGAGRGGGGGVVSRSQKWHVCD